MTARTVSIRFAMWAKAGGTGGINDNQASRISLRSR